MALTIRKAQIRTLRLSASLGYIEDLCAHARAHHASAVARLAPDTTETVVKRAMEAAAEFEIFSKRGLARFLDLALTLGLPFPREVQDILQSMHPSDPEARLHRAWRCLLFELEAKS